MRARGVAGRHVRIFEKDGGYHLDLYKGVDAVSLNGQLFQGGPISPGDRITIGEATITITAARGPIRQTPVTEVRVSETVTIAPPAASVPTSPAATTPSAPAAPATEVEYRTLRLGVYRLSRESQSAEHFATALVDFLDREFPPSEWAVGELSAAHGFRPLASSFFERPALPPRVLEDVASGERVVRCETVAGVLTLVLEPPREGGFSLAILVRENPRLPARAVLLLEEVAQIAGIVLAGSPFAGQDREREGRAVPVEIAPRPDPLSGAELMLRETDDLKKIMDTVTREVIDRAMRRVEGNQSRAAAVLNISRGSLIAKLKEYQIPDYRYLRRERRR